MFSEIFTVVGCNLEFLKEKLKTDLSIISRSKFLIFIGLVWAFLIVAQLAHDHVGG